MAAIVAFAFGKGTAMDKSVFLCTAWQVYVPVILAMKRQIGSGSKRFKSRPACSMASMACAYAAYVTAAASTDSQWYILVWRNGQSSQGILFGNFGIS
ncbi:hypothetical protein NPIL_35211 [Nephila pilipes]|uniref:Uncharacterized protein n=1 Tax=Nephila pilipes TaxID=299642 RepID=A0A8X6TF16_NEPPI|nr:hypothetical protein NPIL_35211 [Nephila pilipes]